ncbi:MAG: FecR family protein [Devosia sp.]
MLSVYKLAAAALAVLALTTLPALADDWVAVKLRGLVYQLVDGQWERLDRRDVVPDDRVIRTAANGSAVFQRGGESITLSGNTQIQIFDKAGAQNYTTVHEHFGTVAIEAEVQNVQHFEVDTPYLAAVVKGTKFIVTSGEDGASVEVTRGKVQVTDRHTQEMVLVKVGETATVVPEGSTTVLTLVDGAGVATVIEAVASTPVLTTVPNAGGVVGETGALVNNVLTNTVNGTGNVVNNTVNNVGGVVNGLLGGDDNEDEDDEGDDDDQGSGSSGRGSSSSGSNGSGHGSGRGGLGGLIGGLL